MEFAYKVVCMDGNSIIGSLVADGIEEAIDLVADDLEKEFASDNHSIEKMSYEDIVRNMTIKRKVMDGTQLKDI